MDRSFLRPDAASHAFDLSRAIVALGGSLGLQVVAEGIELEEQMIRLRDLGCGFGQGFYFARPMDRLALLKYLTSHGAHRSATGTDRIEIAG